MAMKMRTASLIIEAESSTGHVGEFMMTANSVVRRFNGDVRGSSISCGLEAAARVLGVEASEIAEHFAGEGKQAGTSGMLNIWFPSRSGAESCCAAIEMRTRKAVKRENIQVHYRY